MLYSRKGCESVDIGYVWEVSWRRGQTATYWPQVPLYYSSTSSSFCWAAQPGSWGPKPSVWRWHSLRHLVPNCDCNSNWTLPASNSNSLQLQLTQAVCGTRLYNCLTYTCFPWALHLHRIQPVHRSSWYSDIFDWMYLFLDWRLGRRSICYKGKVIASLEFELANCNISVKYVSRYTIVILPPTAEFKSIFTNPSARAGYNSRSIFSKV